LALFSVTEEPSQLGLAKSCPFAISAEIAREATGEHWFKGLNQATLFFSVASHRIVTRRGDLRARRALTIMKAVIH
jgi:hypothetical protein